MTDLKTIDIPFYITCMNNNTGFVIAPKLFTPVRQNYILFTYLYIQNEHNKPF